jgi:hypothetical protein
MASNPRRLKPSTKLSFGYKSKQCHRKIKIDFYVINMCFRGRNRFAFKEIMSRMLKCFWSTLAGALYELNHQPTSLIKKNSLLQKLHPNL